ncbi:MAG: hypothetical protein P4M15_09510, partial [Alphaproteobacteria bacterium]|nr:hypothetical protein [Alphaproteobacteria bacterium]
IQQKGIFAQLETAVGNVKAAAPVSTTQVGQAVNASDQPAAASTAAPSAAPPSSAPAAPSWSSFFSAGQAIFNNVVNPGSGAATGAGK